MRSTFAAPVVLVVEDDPDVQTFLLAILPGLGVTPRPATTLPEARAALGQDDAVAAALVDLHLPGTNGVAVVEALRQARQGLPCCLMTGDAPDAAGMTTLPEDVRILTKPFTFAALRQAFQGLLGQP